MLSNLNPEQTGSYFEKVLGGTTLDCAIFDLNLFAQVVRVLDGSLQTLNCQEGGQVGCVRGDENEREESPNAADEPN